MKEPDPKKVKAAAVPLNYLIGWFRPQVKGNSEAKELADKWVKERT